MEKERLIPRLEGMIFHLILVVLVPSISTTWAQSMDSDVIPGVEVLLAEQLQLIRGMRVGLITNHTGVDRQGLRNVDRLARTPGVQLVALFSPEHGLAGKAQAGENVQSSLDKATGLPVYSLYGQSARPSVEMLRTVQVLLYDIQDTGTRFYTYITTMQECMLAAAEQEIPFVVLDRPAPLGGRVIEGPVLEDSFHSFVGAYDIPIRYGMTPGELALYFKSRQRLPLKLSIVKMKDWKRDQWYDQTGLPWVSPSPNLPSLQSVVVYPGMCLLEGTNLSEGRGTSKPFETAGSPWIDGGRMAEALNRARVEGVHFRAVFFTPSLSKFARQKCQGVELEVTDRNHFQPVTAALALIQWVRQTYPAKFRWNEEHFDRLAGTRSLRLALEANQPIEEIERGWQSQLAEYDGRWRKAWLYP